MSKYKGQCGKKGQQIRAGVSPPPFSGNCRKNFFSGGLPLFDSRYDEKTTNNDIALLKLKKKIDFKKYSGTVLPVCLPDLPRKYYGETVTHKTKIVAFFSSTFLHQVTVSGWGLLSDGGKGRQVWK